MWMSKLKNQRKMWCSFYTSDCWGLTTWDIWIPASYSSLSWSIPKWLLNSLEIMFVMKNVPLWGKPFTSPFEAVLLTTVNSRKNSGAVISRPLPGTRRWAVQIWGTTRFWPYFIFAARVSILDSLFFSRSH